MWSCPFVCLSVRLFQLASELSCDILARGRSAYCPHGAISLFFFGMSVSLASPILGACNLVGLGVECKIERASKIIRLCGGHLVEFGV